MLTIEENDTIPEFVTVFDRTYQLTDMPVTSQYDGVIGLAAYRDGVIYLDSGVDISLQLSTLWHEAVHMAQNDLRNEVSEEEARFISVFVHNVLMNNPWIAIIYTQIHGLLNTTSEVENNDTETNARSSRVRKASGSANKSTTRIKARRFKTYHPQIQSKTQRRRLTIRNRVRLSRGVDREI